jgi:hypothetical protein
MTQLLLDDLALAKRERREQATAERARSIEEAFWTFHDRHPEVYAAVVRLCREWRARGAERWSIEGAFAVLRWQRRLSGLPDPREAYKLNDHYTSRYARLVMEQEPDLAGIFETRELHS